MAKKIPKKILLIEDDKGMIKTLEKWVRVAGRDVISAVDGESGIKRAEKELPDCILLDLMLPGMDGTEVIKRLREEPTTRNIPIICITAYMGVETDKGDERIMVDGKWYRIFAKPLHSMKLLSEIRKAINRREHKLKSKKGMSLLDNLAAVVIISMAASMAIPKYQKTIEFSKSAEALINLAAIKRSIERCSYYDGSFEKCGPGFENLDIDDPNLVPNARFRYEISTNKSVFQIAAIRNAFEGGNSLNRIYIDHNGTKSGTGIFMNIR